MKVFSCAFDPAQSQKPGVYTLRQLCATLGRVQLVLPHLYPVVQYEVYSQEPQLSIQPLTGESPSPASVCVCVCVCSVSPGVCCCLRAPVGWSAAAGEVHDPDGSLFGEEGRRSSAQ